MSNISEKEKKFLDAYEKLTEKHGKILVPKLIVTPEGIVPRLQITDKPE